ncbi:iron permease, partial [Peribacillus sp. SIMBA_075]
YMAFKFVGVSVHALQVTGHLSAHSSDFLVHIPTLGIYANWETTVPQIIVLAIVIFNFFFTTRKKTVKPIPQIN